MSEQYTIHYFDARGWAEPIRMILSYAGADWKDKRITYTSFPTPIPPEIKERAPYGQVPLLEVNGEILAQSQTIARYLARKFKLTGANEWEAAKCDEVVDAARDFSFLYVKAWTEQDEEKKKEIINEATKNGREKFISRFNSILDANGGHFVGSELTWADIITASSIEYQEKLWGVQVAEGFPAVQKLLQTVFNAKGIKEWVEKRPETKF